MWPNSIRNCSCPSCNEVLDTRVHIARIVNGTVVPLQDESCSWIRAQPHCMACTPTGPRASAQQVRLVLVGPVERLPLVLPPLLPDPLQPSLLEWPWLDPHLPAYPRSVSTCLVPHYLSDVIKRKPFRVVKVVKIHAQSFLLLAVKLFDAETFGSKNGEALFYVPVESDFVTKQPSRLLTERDMLAGTKEYSRATFQSSAAN